jgi:hypothetical protein
MSYETRTVADQKAALTAVARLVSAFGHLPAPEWNVSRIYPEQVDVSLHDDLGDFEQWRTVLGIGPDDIKYRTQSGAIVLTAKIQWGGASVNLVGYGPLPLHDVERGEPA